MIYTTFAIMAVSLIFFMAMMPVMSTVDVDTSEAIRIGEASFYLESVLEDLERSTEIATTRGLTGASNYIIATGEPLEDAEDGLTEAIVDGSINGVELNATENASLGEWSSKVEGMAESAGYQLELEVSDYSLDSSGFYIHSSKEIDASLKDPVTLATFNRSRAVEVEASIDGAEDPLLLMRSIGRYTVAFNQCGFEQPANLLGTGVDHSSPSVLGEAVVNPEDTGDIEDKADKILVVDGGAELEQDVDSFAGVVSRGDSDPVGTEYIYNTGNLGIETGQDLILSGEQVWESNFREMIFDDCYVPAEAPGIMERYENDLTEVENGILTFVDVSSLPDELRYMETAVGYKYFPGNSQGALHTVDGVTERYPWFRLDDEDVNRWNLHELTS